MGYVYGDVFFLMNWAVDAVCLWLAGRYAGLAVRPWQLAGAAALGAGYALASLYPAFAPTYSPLGLVALSLVLVAVAYHPLDGRALLRATACFYLASLALAGGALAGARLLDRHAAALGWVRGAVGLDAPAVLVGLVAATALVGWVAWGALVRRRWRDALTVAGEVVLGKARAPLVALVDTGNRLRDPLSQAPVVIVHYPAVARVLPAEVRGLLDQAGVEDVGRLADRLSGVGWGARFRLVPFEAIGRPRGMLLGFRPDGVVLREGGRVVVTRDVVIGLVSQPLAPDGGFNALVPPELLESA